MRTLRRLDVSAAAASSGGPHRLHALLISKPFRYGSIRHYPWPEVDPTLILATLISHARESS